jgi:hypothetical protein
MSFPRLYLASGEPTASTVGTLEPYTDFTIKKRSTTAAEPDSPDDARPYMHITRGELEAALTTARARGLKIRDSCV